MDSIIFEAIKDVFLPYLGGVGQPAMRLWIMLGVGLIAGTIVLGWVGSMLSGGSVSRIMGFVAMVVGVGLVVLGIALTSLYLVPMLDSKYSLYVLIGGGALLFLIIMVPIVSKMNGLSYLVALVTSFAAVLAAVLLMYLAGLAFDLIVQGSGNMQSRRKQKQREDRILSD